jgi:phosphotransacetylase
MATETEKFVEGLFAAARGNPGRVVVPAADNLEALEGIAMAMNDGVLRGGTLIGEPESIRNVAAEAGLCLTSFNIVDEPDWDEAADLAVSLIVKGEADFLLKGKLGTKEYLKAVLNKKHGLVREGDTLSHVALASIPMYHKPLLFTDAAINIEPDVETKAQMIRNVATVANGLGIAHPLVALVAAVEKINPKIKSTMDAAELVKMAAAGAFPGTEVEGPYDLYIALSLEAAGIKCVCGKVCGNADILVFPELNCANVFYKTISLIPDAWIAGIVGGASIPILLPSRADSAMTKRMSVVVAAALAGKKRQAS